MQLCLTITIIDNSNVVFTFAKELLWNVVWEIVTCTGWIHLETLPLSALEIVQSVSISLILTVELSIWHTINLSIWTSQRELYLIISNCLSLIFFVICSFRTEFLICHASIQSSIPHQLISRPLIHQLIVSIDWPTDHAQTARLNNIIGMFFSSSLSLSTHSMSKLHV